MAFPDYEKFWGQHNPKTLSKPNAITVIRPLKDTIVSVCSSKKIPNLQSILESYCYFYETIEQYDVYFCLLSSLVLNPNQIMFDYAKKYNLDGLKPVDIEEYKTNMLKRFPDNYPKANYERQEIIELYEKCDLSKADTIWQKISNKCAI